MFETLLMLPLPNSAHTFNQAPSRTSFAEWSVSFATPTRVTVATPSIVPQISFQ
jgi:hypothetical protein